jgi:transcriptional regulator with XRE-family HTH domain
MEPSFDSFCLQLGRRVKALRVRRHLTQEDMMERGFSLRHYQRIEAGRSVSMWTLWKLALAFNVRPHEVLPRTRAPQASATRRRAGISKAPAGGAR